MKIVKIHAGLGNQMFQYALVLALKKYGHKVKIDSSEFEVYNVHNGYELGRAFNIHLPQISKHEQKLFYPQRQRVGYRILRFLLGTNNSFYIEYPELSFNEAKLRKPKSEYLSGYWQHHKYVDLIEKELREDFKFPSFQDEINISLARKLTEAHNTISIHIRRGDYLDHPTLSGISDKAYYEKAVQYMMQQVENPLFVFFSNDIPWCKENFNLSNAVFVDWNTAENSFRDMQLMSLCDHHIISNSSFSWWGAWLNTNSEKMVVAPKMWIRNAKADSKALLLDQFVLI